MTKIFVMFLMLIFNTVIINSQSFLNLGIKAENPPNVDMWFSAFDKDYNIVRNFQLSDFEIRENGELAKLISVGCPTQSSNDTIKTSFVFTIDVSGSMDLGNPRRINIVKNAFGAVLDEIDFNYDECALTSFDHRSFINKDFTQDKNELIDASTDLKPLFSTDHYEAFLGVNGGLTVMNNARNGRKVMILLTDGATKFNSKDVLDEAAKQGIEIYCITIEMSMPKNLKEVAESTGGEWFENISTTADLVAAFKRIYFRSGGLDDCSISWESSIKCVDKVEVELKITSLNITWKGTYERPKGKTPTLTFSPSALSFGSVTPPQTKELTVQITANNGDIEVQNSSIANPFSVVDWGGTQPPFVLEKDKKRTIKIRFTPPDTSGRVEVFQLTTNACRNPTLALMGGAGRAIVSKDIRTLSIIHPNGGEVLSVCDSILIEWEGLSISDTVEISASTDAGKTWFTIEEKFTGANEYIWWHGGIMSNQCWVRVEQLGPIEYEENTIRNMSPHSYVDVITHPTNTNLNFLQGHSYSPSTIYNKSNKQFVYTEGFGGPACFNHDGSKYMQIPYGNVILTYRTSDGVFLNENQIAWTTLNRCAADRYNKRFLVSDLYTSKIYILNDDNLNILDSVAVHDSEIYFFDFNQDGSKMVTSAKNEAVIWDMTKAKPDTIQIIRNTGGVHFHFNSANDELLHYVSGYTLYTYNHNTHETELNGLNSISEENEQYMPEIASLEDGVSFVLGTITTTNIRQSGKEKVENGNKLRIINTSNNTQGILQDFPGTHYYSFIKVRKTYDAKGAVIALPFSRPIAAFYNHSNGQIDTLHDINYSKAYPVYTRLSTDGSKIIFGTQDFYWSKWDRKTQKLEKDTYSRSMHMITDYDNGEKLLIPGIFYAEQYSKDLLFEAGLNETGKYQSDGISKLQQSKNFFSIPQNDNKLQEESAFGSVVRTYDLNNNYSSYPIVTVTEDGDLIVACQKDGNTDLYYFQQGVASAIYTSTLYNTSINNGNNSGISYGGGLIGLLVNNEMGQFYKIYTSEFDEIRSYANSYDQTTYMITRGGKHRVTVEENSKIRVRRLDNDRIVKEYIRNDASNASHFSSSSGDQKWVTLGYHKPTSIVNQFDVYVGVFDIDIPYFQSDTSDNVFSIVKPIYNYPNSLDIGDSYKGYPVDKTFIANICNINELPIEIKTANMKFDNQIKLLTDLEGFILEPGECIDLEFRLLAQTLGTQKDSLICQIGCDSIKIEILGNVINPALEVVQKIIDFGKVNVFTTKEMYSEQTVQNISNQSINVNEVTLEGPDKVQFTIIDGASPFTLSPSQIHSMDLRFSPTRRGKTSTLLSFPYSQSPIPAEVLVIGEGVETTIANIIDTLDFGNLTCKSMPIDSLIQLICINGDLIVKSHELTNGQNFKVNGLSINQVIQKDQSSSFTVRFESDKAGEYSGELRLSLNAANFGDDSIAVVYLKAKLDSVALWAEPDIADFGTARDITDREIEVRNTGNVAISITDGVIDNDKFELLSPELPLELKVGESETFLYRFIPTDTLAQVALSRLDYFPCGQLEIPLVTGGGASRIFVVDSIKIDLFTCSGSVKDTLLEIFNIGTSTLQIFDIDIIEGDYSDRILIRNFTPNSTIARNNSIKVDLQLENLEAGEIEIDLIIKSDSYDNSEKLVKLIINVEEVKIEVEPEIIDFGLVQGNASDVIEVKNTSLIPIKITNSKFSNNRFTLQNVVFPIVIGANSSQSFTVVFTPTDTFSVAAPLELYAEPCGSVLVDLLGGGGTPVIRSITKMDIFGSSCQTTSLDSTFKIYNMGSLPLIIESITKEGEARELITLEYEELPITIEPRQSKDITVKFNDIITTNQQAIVKFISNAINQAVYPINFNLINKAANLLIAPEKVDFGLSNVPLTKTVSVTNIGTQDLSISDIISEIEEVKVLNLSTPILLRVGNTLLFDLEFTPNDTFSIAGLVKLKFNPCGEYPINIYGGGGTPQIQVPDPIAYHKFSCQIAVLDTLVNLSNLGNGLLTISDVIIAGDPGAFIFDRNQLPIVVEPRSSKLIKIGFNALIQGEYQGTLTFVGNQVDGDKTIQLSGIIEEIAPVLSNDLIDFGITNEGTTSEIEISNTAEYELIIDELTIDNTHFKHVAPPLPIILPSNSKRVLKFEFNPTNNRPQRGLVSINSTPCGNIRLNLIGGGQEFDVTTIEELEIELDPCNLLPVNESFEVWNLGNTPIVVTAINVLPNDGMIEFPNLNFPITIDQRKSRQFNLFIGNPPLENKSYEVVLKTNAPGFEEVRLMIKVKSGFVDLDILPSIIDFGLVKSFSDEIFTITNKGNIGAEIKSIYSTDVRFEILNANFPIPIEAEQTLEFTARFSPTDTLSVFSDLIVETQPCGYKSIEMLGGGGTPQIQCDSLVSFFSPPCNNSDVERQIRIFNMGIFPLVIENLEIIGVDLDNYYIATPNTPFEVNPRSSLVINVFMKPDKNGVSNADLIITSNSLVNSRKIVKLFGEKFNVDPQFDELNVDYGTINGLIEKTITITNYGNSELILQNANIIGRGYEITNPRIPIAIPAGQNQEITIRFRPQEPNTYNAQINFSFTPCGNQVVNLIGTYENPNYAGIELYIGSGSEEQGKIVAIPIQLKNAFNLENSSVTKIKGKLNYRYDLLYPADANSIFVVDGFVRSQNVEIDLNELNLDSTLRYNFYTGLGGVEETDVTLTDLEFDTGNLDVRVFNGKFNLIDICYEGGTRLINSQGILRLSEPRPNPSAYNFELELETIENGHTKLEIINATGSRVKSLIDAFLIKGSRLLNVSTDDLSSGTYYIVLSTPTLTKEVKLQVIK